MPLSAFIFPYLPFSLSSLYFSTLSSAIILPSTYFPYSLSLPIPLLLCLPLLFQSVFHSHCLVLIFPPSLSHSFSIHSPAPIPSLSFFPVLLYLTESPVPALSTTTRTPPPQSISNAACSGCLLPKPPHKTEIRPLSLPLPPAPAAVAPPPLQPRPVAAAPTPPPGIFPGAVPARAEQPGRLVPEVYLSQTEKLVQFTMRQLATPPTPAPTTTPAPRVPRPTPPGFPIPGQPVLQLPINHPASLPLITPLRITAQSPFPPLAPAIPLGLVGAGDRGLNVALPFQQSIAQSQVDAAQAASQQFNTYTSTHTQTQTLPHGVSSSSFASSFSSSYPSRGAAKGGKQASLKPLNTQVDPSSALDSTQLGTVQPATFDVSKLDRIPPATSGPKDLQSHAFGRRPQGGAQGTAQGTAQSSQLNKLDKIAAGTISRGHVFGNPMTGAVVAQSNLDKIPAADEGQSYGNPFVKDSATAHSSPVGIATGAVATPVHQGVIFGNTPQDFAAAQSVLDSLALGTVPAAFAGAAAQGNVFGSPAAAGQQSNVYGTPTAGATAAQSTLVGTSPQQGSVFGRPAKGAAAALSSLAGISTGTAGTPAQQGQIFGNPAQGSAFGVTPNQQGSLGTYPQGSSALNSPAQSRIPATFGATPTQQGTLFGTASPGTAAGQSALGRIPTGTTPTQQSTLFSGASNQGAAATQSAVILPAIATGATPAQQTSVFGATQAAPQGSAAAQQTPANSNQANLQGNPNAGGLTRPTPERPFLINATPSPLRVPYPVPPLSNAKVVNSLQQVVLPGTQTITKLMRGPPALEKFLHQATPVPARLHQSASPPAAVSPFHETVGTSPLTAAASPHTAAVTPHSSAVTPLSDAASLHTAASSPHSTASVANRPQGTQQIVANQLQNIALPVSQHIGDLLVQNTHDTPVQHSTAHSHTPSAPTLSKHAIC